MLKSQFLADWKLEYRDIADYIQACADWISHFAEIESPLCAEARRRLRLIHERMKSHFERESELEAKLAAHHRGGSSIEFASLRHSAAKDQAHLLARVQALIGQLEKCDVIEWEAVAYELNLFLDAFEQHQETTEESIGWLFPNATLL